VAIVDALDLIVLGRELSRIGQLALRGGEGSEKLPVGRRLVIVDVLGHPDSPIAEITARTGLPQSYVSETVGWMRDKGFAQTSSDPVDGRRTLVRITSTHADTVASHGARDAEPSLRAALRGLDDQAIDSLVACVSELVERLRPNQAGPALSELAGGRVTGAARSQEKR
jgi:DNA-binding MarR family transcriptional regulator